MSDPNRIGAISCVNLLLPVVRDRAGLLDERLAALPRGSGSPFAGLLGTHVARLVLIPQLGAIVNSAEHQNDPHLLLGADVDGDGDSYITALAHERRLDGVLGCCVGHPGPERQDRLRAWLARHRFDAGFSITPYTSASVDQVQHALALRERLAAFALAADGEGTGRLRARFREAFGW